LDRARETGRERQTERKEAETEKTEKKNAETVQSSVVPRRHADPSKAREAVTPKAAALWKRARREERGTQEGEGKVEFVQGQNEQGDVGLRRLSEQRGNRHEALKMETEGMRGRQEDRGGALSSGNVKDIISRSHRNTHLCPGDGELHMKTYLRMIKGLLSTGVSERQFV